VAYNTTLTWANPALVTLEQQMEVPLFGDHPVEMGVTDANKGRILARLRRDPWYRVRFRLAFPRAKQPVSFTTIVRSIAAFERTIVSADSRYDRYLKRKATLSPAEKRGMNLFMSERTGCTHCHGGPNFNDQMTYVGAPDERPLFHNTGLYNLGGTGAYPAPNRGIFESTGRPADMGRFRAPSLRNVALTAPYMHDGSIKTLREVIDFYAAGGRVISHGPLAGDGRANPYKDAEISPLNLSARDRADLVAFLRSLTDWRVVKDRRFSDPFRDRPNERRAGRRTTRH
jgi:cytochrome c peroxidase